MGNCFLFYIILCIFIKSILVVASFTPSFLLSMPYFLAWDLVAAAGMFLCIDLPYRAFSRGVRKMLTPFLFTAYLSLIVLTFLNIKLYFSLGTFLTYDLLVQVSDFKSFGKSLASEIDFSTIVCVIAALIFATATAYYGRRKMLSRRHIYRPVPALIIVLIFASSTVYSRTSRKAFNSIDRDPVVEFTSSAFSGKRDTIDRKLAVSTITAGNFSDAMLPLPLSGKAAGMNIVFVFLESTTPAYLDETTTPNLERLSNNALVMTEHYTPEPATMKALYAMFTGRFPYITREWLDFYKLTEKDLTFPEILKKNGYHTEFVTTAEGKTYYQNRFLSKRVDKNSDRPVIKQMFPDLKEFAMGISDDGIVRYFKRFLDERGKGKFFITICGVNPHHPYEFPSEKHNIHGTKTPFDRYRNSLHAADDMIGQCYELLRERSLEKNTLFLVVSDHGEAFYQHPRNFLHSLFVYDENVHTVCMLVNPALFPSRRVVTMPTSHIDLAPTLLDLTGTSADGAAFDGTSILAGGNRRALFFTSFSVPYAGCRDGKYKYIANRRYGTEELYDLESDPGEHSNIASAHPEVCEKLRSAAAIFPSGK